LADGSKQSSDRFLLRKVRSFRIRYGSRKYGHSWNQFDQSNADYTALRVCAASGCMIVFRTGPKECGAIALSADEKAWGGARRDRRDAAQLAALENCQKRTGVQCKILASECNR